MKRKELIGIEKFYKIRVNKKNSPSNNTRRIAPIKEKKIKLNINKNNNNSKYILRNEMINEKPVANTKSSFITNQIVIDKMKLINNFNISIPYQKKNQENLKQRTPPNNKIYNKIKNGLNINNGFQMEKYIILLNKYRQKLITEFIRHIQKAFLFQIKSFFKNFLKNLKEIEKTNIIIKKNIMNNKPKSNNILNNIYNTHGKLIKEKKMSDFQKTELDEMPNKRIKQKIISMNIIKSNSSSKEEIKTKRIYSIKNKVFQNLNYSSLLSNNKYNLSLKNVINSNSPNIYNNKILNTEKIENVKNRLFQYKNIYHKRFINCKSYNLSFQNNSNKASKKINEKKNTSLYQIINSDYKQKFFTIFQDKNIKNLKDVNIRKDNFNKSKLIKNNKIKNEKINLRTNYFLYLLNKTRKIPKIFTSLKPQKQFQYNYYKDKKIYCKKKFDGIKDEEKPKKITNQLDKYFCEKISNFIKIIQIFCIKKYHNNFVGKLKEIQKFYKHLIKFSSLIKKYNFIKVYNILKNLKKNEDLKPTRNNAITNNNGINNNSSNDNNNKNNDSKNYKINSDFTSTENIEDSNKDNMNVSVPQESMVIRQFIADKPVIINNNNEKNDLGIVPFNYEDLFFKIRIFLISRALHKKKNEK